MTWLITESGCLLCFIFICFIKKASSLTRSKAPSDLFRHLEPEHGLRSRKGSIQPSCVESGYLASLRCCDLQAWARAPVETLQLVAHLRDVREGKGERERGWDAYIWLAHKHPRTLLVNLPEMVKVLHATTLPRCGDGDTSLTHMHGTALQCMYRTGCRAAGIIPRLQCTLYCIPAHVGSSCQSSRHACALCRLASGRTSCSCCSACAWARMGGRQALGRGTRGGCPAGTPGSSAGWLSRRGCACGRPL